MSSTKLLLWKHQKGSSRYPMILYKRDSTADFFLKIFNFFSDELFRDLVHLDTLSFSWHFCTYFWRAQAFRYISTASLTFDIVSFFTKKDTNNLILGLANILLRKPSS